MSNLSIKKLPMDTSYGKFETDDDDFREHTREVSQNLLLTQARRKAVYEELKAVAQVGPGRNLVDEIEQLEKSEKALKGTLSEGVTEHFKGLGGSWKVGNYSFTVSKSVPSYVYDDDTLQAHPDLLDALGAMDVDGTPLLRLAINPAAMGEAIRRELIDPDLLEQYGVLEVKPGRAASVRITEKKRKK